jgi:YD repeat-containing protein
VRNLLIALPLAQALLFGAYQYQFSGPPSSIDTNRWTVYGTPTTTSTGPTGSSALISRVGATDGTADFEVKTQLSLSPTFANGACTASLNVTKRISPTDTTLGSTTAPCHNGMTMRSFIRGTTIWVMIDDVRYLELWDGGIPTGQPGVGVWAVPAGNSIQTVWQGMVDRARPSAVNAQSIGVSAFSNRVDLQWQGAADDPNGVGIAYYLVCRSTDGSTSPNGSGCWASGHAYARTPELEDDNVYPGIAYTYQIFPTDYHSNEGPGVAFTVNSPDAGDIDPRRSGVRPEGVYWDAAGEQIDMRSGNLNFSLPLLKAQGRGGWGVTFALSYNSQLWRKDNGGTWKLGRDVGYGFGWRLMAGSVTPYWWGWGSLDHYVFTDASGAEYRLDVNTNGVWTSRESTYVSYDANTQRLYFTDGSFWVMGAVSAGTEEDAGAMYPTLMQDSNGNQILVRYYAGRGVSWANSSARIQDIEDVRAVWVGDLHTTFTFAYTADTLHLTDITNHIQSGETRHLTIALNQPLQSPFSPPVAYAATSLLQSVRDATGLTHSFEYDGSGELTKVTFPYNGHLRWDYHEQVFSANRTLGAVDTRYLAASSGAAETAHGITLAVNEGGTVESWSCVQATGVRCWAFNSDRSSWRIGLPVQRRERLVAGGAIIREEDYAWAQDPAGRPSIQSVLTILDQGASYQTKTEQTLDAHGNVTQTKLYDYGNLTTPARIYTNTYLTGANYTSRYIFNRLLTSQVSDGNGNGSVTLLSNTYDSDWLTDRSGLREHDDGNYGTSFFARGNLTRSTRPGAVRNMRYDVTGTVVTADDSSQHSLTVLPAEGTNYAAPGKDEDLAGRLRPGREGGEGQREHHRLHHRDPLRAVRLLAAGQGGAGLPALCARRHEVLHDVHLRRRGPHQQRATAGWRQPHAVRVSGQRDHRD